MEVTLLDHRFLRAKPSMLAAIGMFTSKKMLGGEWVSYVTLKGHNCKSNYHRLGRCLCLLLRVHGRAAYAWIPIARGEPRGAKL